jgi:hypothetical protein
VIELFLALLLIPALTISCWDRLMHRLSANARRVYRLTGLIGVPIHELSHAAVCVLFGMRIKQISFYQFNSETSTMGFVRFRFSPLSLRHAVGLTLQGIAPLVAGILIVTSLIDAYSGFARPSGGFLPLALWLVDVSGNALSAAGDMAVAGPKSLLLLVLALIVSMHAIPSMADIVSGLRGLIMLIIFLALAAIGVELFWTYEGRFDTQVAPLLEQAVQYIERALWCALHGAVSMVTLAIAGGILLIVLPAVVLYCVDFVRGARGKV